VAFVKAIWKFIVGVKDVLVLCFMLLFFGTLFAILSMSPGERPVRTTSGALLLDLNGVIVEQPQRVDPLAMLFGSEAPMREYALRDVVTALDAARSDPNVKAVVLNLNGFMGGGQVALSRVGAALEAVRAAKKPVLTYATIYEDSGYQLASHASEVWVHPFGAVALAGPGGSTPYLKGLLDRLGITAHIYRVGTYKSAVEPLMRSDQSPEAKEAARALAGALWQNWQDEVKKARPRAALASYAADPVAAAEAAQGDLALAAKKNGLVDKVGDERAFADHVANIAGEGTEREGPAFAALDLAEYTRAKTPANHGQIGVITIAGTIMDGEHGPGTAGGDTIADLIDDAVDKGNLKALVIRVDSPGGSVLASEKIRSAIVTAKQKGLPIVTSMGNLAASGGYWVSTASDRIIAEPSTITGSIGVFGVLPSFEKLLAKIGVGTDGVATTPLSGQPDIMGGFSPEFDRMTQLGIEDVYRRFLTIVGQARHMRPDDVDKIAQGRVWDGGTARQIGLIDSYGGLDDAIREAGRLAKIDPASVRPFYIDPKVDPFARFVEDMVTKRDGGKEGSTAAQDLIARQSARHRLALTQAFGSARMMIEGASIQAACLECRAYSPTAMEGKDRQNDWSVLMLFERLFR
jgi:protease-4